MAIADDMDIAAQLALRARTHLDLWWEYEGADSRPQHVEIMNTFVDFFRFDSHAHFLSAVMYLAQLLETDQGNLNLQRLTALAEASGAQGASSARQILVGVAHLARKISIVRSNLYAHRSANLDADDVFTKAMITADELREASNATLGAINHLLKGIGRDTWEFRRGAVDDLRKVLNALRR